MWDLMVPVIGRCRECGEELSTQINVRATHDWITRYQSDERLRRGVDQAVVRLAVARHARRCLGRTHQRLALAAASA
jgi:hypothetical protein